MSDDEIEIFKAIIAEAAEADPSRVALALRKNAQLIDRTTEPPSGPGLVTEINDGLPDIFKRYIPSKLLIEPITVEPTDPGPTRVLLEKLFGLQEWIIIEYNMIDSVVIKQFNDYNEAHAYFRTLNSLERNHAFEKWWRSRPPKGIPEPLPPPIKPGPKPRPRPIKKRRELFDFICSFIGSECDHPKVCYRSGCVKARPSPKG